MGTATPWRPSRPTRRMRITRTSRVPRRTSVRRTTRLAAGAVGADVEAAGDAARTAAGIVGARCRAGMASRGKLAWGISSAGSATGTAGGLRAARTDAAIRLEYGAAIAINPSTANQKRCRRVPSPLSPNPLRSPSEEPAARMPKPVPRARSPPAPDALVAPGALVGPGARASAAKPPAPRANPAPSAPAHAGACPLSHPCLNTRISALRRAGVGPWVDALVLRHDG